jgi:hypothetical protein
VLQDSRSEVLTQNDSYFKNKDVHGYQEKVMGFRGLCREVAQPSVGSIRPEGSLLCSDHLAICC